MKAYPQAYRPCAAVLGIALVAAAVFKIKSTGTMPASPLTELLPGWANGLIPVVEFLLGIWLLSGYCRYGAWMVGELFLILFALHGLFLTMSKQSSCGCLGDVTVPPVIIVLFDVTLFVTLLRCRPNWAGWPANSPALRTAGVAAGVIAALMAFAAIRYGSIHVAVAAARGEALATQPASLNLGRVEAGTRTERTMRVVNLSSEPVQVLMAASSCQCAEVADLPVTIEPGRSVDLAVIVAVTRQPGEFKRVGRLRTSAGDLDFKIVAFVSISQSDPAVSRVQREVDR